jgi:hypothetical protein
MVMTKEILKEDLTKKTTYDFFVTYVAKSHCWYFSDYLKISKAEMLSSIDDLREIISRALKINFNSIHLVGSAKVGFSLKPVKDFCLQPFRESGEQQSDIDIALISNELFFYWRHLVKVKKRNIDTPETTFFESIMASSSNGYINVHDIVSINILKKEWLVVQNNIKKNVSDNLNIRHKLTYRIYKDWDSLENYQLRSIKNSKKIITEGENDNV